MLLRFKEQCVDKNTKKRYSPGAEVEFPDDRAEEILAVGNGRYAEAVEPEADETKAMEKKLKKLSVDELKALTEEMGLPSDGKKAEIVARIMEAEAGNDEGQDE